MREGRLTPLPLKKEGPEHPGQRILHDKGGVKKRRDALWTSFSLFPCNGNILDDIFDPRNLNLSF